MQDRILEGYVKDFSSQYRLDKLSPQSLFSYLVNYCVISRQTAAALSLDDFDVDGGQDLGIDAIAVLINGRVVNAKEPLTISVTSSDASTSNSSSSSPSPLPSSTVAILARSCWELSSSSPRTPH
jgi:hypothetical protein